MAGGVFSTAKLYGMTIRESANDGSDFTNPDADYRRLFLGEDGQLHVKDSAGTVTDIGTSSGGDVATDAIFDAKGDLPVGTGANTAQKLTVGANGTRPEAASGETTGIKWSYPPGYELTYNEITSDVNVTNTSEATADTIVTATAISFDGSTTVMIEFQAAMAYSDNVAGVDMYFWLYDGSSSIGMIGGMRSESTNRAYQYVALKRRLTPSNASHTYSVRASLSGSGDGKVEAGAGGSGNKVPAFIRITKA